MTWFNKDSHCSLRAQDSVYTNGRQDFRLTISKQEILKDANLLNCKVELISYLSAEFLDFINSKTYSGDYNIGKYRYWQY